MEGGISVVDIFGNTIREQRFLTIIEEWFENKGSVFTIDEYKAYNDACESRERERGHRWFEHDIKNREDEKHEEQCSCAWEMPEINKSDYFPEEPTPRLLSQVLASIAKVSQIDRLTEQLLTYLKDMSAKEGTKLLMKLGGRIPKVSSVDLPRTGEAAAAPPE